jgi:hypothetical protein
MLVMDVPLVESKPLEQGLLALAIYYMEVHLDPQGEFKGGLLQAVMPRRIDLLPRDRRSLH